MSQVHEGFVSIVAKEGLDFLCPTHTVIEALCIAFFVFIEGVEQVIHPLSEFFLFFFRQFIETKLELVADIGPVDRFVPNDQLDDFSHVGQLVVSKIVERCEETRVEEEGFKEDAGYFLFKGSPIEVDLVDDFCLLLKEGIGIGPFKNLFDF